jgi:Zn-dependent protease
MQDFTMFPVMLVAIIVALTVHEWAHAFTAKKLGDDTAEYAGRLTLNPLAHLDPLGAILFLVVGFGWAKPVPVDVRNFRHPVRDAAIVAFAGPLSNLVLAFLAVLAISFIPVQAQGILIEGSGPTPSQAAWLIFTNFLAYSLRMNLALMAFNLLPIPPLDGSNILRLFLPWRARDRYDEAMRYGPWILLALLLAESFLGVRVISAWVGAVINAVIAVFAAFLGLFGL